MTASPEEFIKVYESLGPSGAASALGISTRAVRARRRSLEQKLGRHILPPGETNQRSARLQIDMEDGLILVGSDAHYWPGQPSTGHRAFVEFAEEFQPDVIVMNGDVLDAACISRFPPIGWEGMPTVRQELDVAKERLDEIREAAPHSRYVWTLGNHDARFETRLASVAPEFKHVHGVHLKDHFPSWEPCWSCFVGDDGHNGVVIKHRFKGGIHAPHNNTLWAGRSIVTGHLHSLKVNPITDYNGTRFGVDGGCLADPMGDQFTGYTEDNPLNWRQGFLLLTIERGRLLWPEIVHVIEPGLIEFRGATRNV